MKKRVKITKAKRAPAKACISKRTRKETGSQTNSPLEKLLHDAYTRRACQLR